MSEAGSLVARLMQLPALAAADADLLRRGRFLSAAMLVGVGGATVHVDIEAGQVVRIEAGRKLMRSWRFAIRGSDRAWAAHWQAVPAPGWHDLFALSKRGELSFEGDLQPLVANLQYVKDLLALPRSAA